MKTDKYFRTTNLTLSVFLYANGQKITGINSVNKDQKEFAFLETSMLEELIDLYKFGDKDDERLLVQVHVYEQARRELLDRLND
jgi:hypothetical protein